jgi:hypothetical protein
VPDYSPMSIHQEYNRINQRKFGRLETISSTSLDNRRKVSDEDSDCSKTGRADKSNISGSSKPSVGMIKINVERVSDEWDNYEQVKPFNSKKLCRSNVLQSNNKNKINPFMRKALLDKRLYENNIKVNLFSGGKQGALSVS